jgi:hypothetical protein
MRLMANQKCILRGYPSQLAYLSLIWPRRKAAKPFAVICTGECLYELQRATIQKAFGAPVINEYGCHETGLSGLSCPEAGLVHLDAERCLFEVIDGSLICTDLLNRTMPMIRYQNGDLVDLNRGPCECGRQGPTVRVLGRAEDVVRSSVGLLPAGGIPLPDLPCPSLLTAQIALDRGLTAELRTTRGFRLDEGVINAIYEWAQHTFSATSVTIRHSVVRSSRTSTKCITRSDWYRALTDGSWNKQLLRLPPPQGELRPIAQLFHDVVSPGVIANRVIPDLSAQLTLLTDSHPFDDPCDEIIAVRLLLFIQSALSQGASATQLSRLWNRSLLAIKRAAGEGLTSLAAAAEIDVVIAQQLGPTNPPDLTLSKRGPRWAADALHIHHLMAAFEAAEALWRHLLPQEIRRLRPALSMFLGDLWYFVGDLGDWFLIPCRQWVAPQTEDILPESISPPDSFTEAWLQWRVELFRDLDAGEIALTKLRALAKDHRQRSRVDLETCFFAIAAGRQPQVEEWTHIVNMYVKSVGGAAEMALLGCTPVLRALVTPLQRSGNSARSYSYLLASTVPSSKASAFDRVSRRLNAKQRVIFDSSTMDSST